MINLNGTLIADETLCFSTQNRALKYGDALFETIRYADGKLLFWEDHYFRLMGAMRLLRMEIPMEYSPEHLQSEILRLLMVNKLTKGAARIRLTVYRDATGYYTPETNAVGFFIEGTPMAEVGYQLNEKGLDIELFRDHYKPKGLLSNIKSTHCLLYTLAGIFARENGFDDCLLLNADKQLVEATSSNLFMVKGRAISTPPIVDGCVKGIMRKQVIKLATEAGFDVKEESLSPFDLHKADEVFLSNAIQGICWVAGYRKKAFTNLVALKLLEKLNEVISSAGDL